MHPLLSLFGLLLVLITACSPAPSPSVQTLWGQSMGTSYSIRLVATESQAEDLARGISKRLDSVNDAMSTYLPRSELSKFNAARPNQWVSISSMTTDVLALALQIAEQTQGAFDPTIAPLVDLWGFGPTASLGLVPEASLIEKALSQVGWQAIELDEAKQRVRKLTERQLDLSAIAKGYAVDLVADYLRNEGMEDFLVEVGGELRFNGAKPNHQPWRVAIETPDTGKRSAYRILEMNTGAMATSGDYRNYFEQDGVRYSHTLDAKTGYPITHNLVSVTVLTDQAALADAYATAFLVMGTEQALALANELALSVYLIEKTPDDYQALESGQFQQLFHTTQE